MQKPPLGLKPKHIHDLERIQEIREAITRYKESNFPIPYE